MTSTPSATIVVDLGFGDAGKGSIVDALANRSPVHTVIRANGGAQAGHGVVTADGRRHIFAQFGSGTFVPGVRTFLSRHMIVQPTAMLGEAARLASLGVHDAFARTSVHEEALVITPFHRSANRLRELLRGDAQHGSCGIGVGETVVLADNSPADALRIGDLRDLPCFKRKLQRTQDIFCEQFRALVGTRFSSDDLFRDELEILRDPRTIGAWMTQLAPFIDLAGIVDDEYFADLCELPGGMVFEGAQGVLLDENYGFHPHTTWSTCTFANALAMLKDAGYAGEITRLGLTRAYGVRHGAGPFVTEDRSLDDLLPEPGDDRLDFAGRFRLGWLDLVALSYALDACKGADALAITCADRILPLPDLRICTKYDLSRLTKDQRQRSFDMSARIRLGPRGDLEYLSAITEALANVRPIYEDLSHLDGHDRIDVLMELIWAELGVPIRIVSTGPTAGDKTYY